MLNRLFPKQIDNSYGGYRLAIWILVAVVAVRLLIATNSILFARHIAATADGIPLDSYGPAAAATIVQIFALLGLHLFIQSLLGVVVLIRYRAMIPLMYLILVLQQVGQKVLHAVYPDVPSAGAPGTTVALSIFAVTLIGFFFSLLDRSSSAARAQA